MEHVNYPHQPGRLISCEACEFGPCQCDPTTAPCTSQECVQSDDDLIWQYLTYGWECVGVYALADSTEARLWTPNSDLVARWTRPDSNSNWSRSEWE